MNATIYVVGDTITEHETTIYEHDYTVSDVQRHVEHLFNVSLVYQGKHDGAYVFRDEFTFYTVYPRG